MLLFVARCCRASVMMLAVTGCGPQSLFSIGFVDDETDGEKSGTSATSDDESADVVIVQDVDKLVDESEPEYTSLGIVDHDLEFEVVEQGKSPNDDFVDRFGDSYLQITSPSSSEILQYSISTGELLTMFDAEDGLVEPRGIVGGTAGIYWTDAGIGELWFARRSYYSELSTRVVAQGFSEPSGVAIDHCGGIYVADTAKGTITRYEEADLLGGNKAAPAELVVQGLHRPFRLEVHASENMILWTQEDNPHIWMSPLHPVADEELPEPSVWFESGGLGGMDVMGAWVVGTGTEPNEFRALHINGPSEPSTFFDFGDLDDYNGIGALLLLGAQTQEFDDHMVIWSDIETGALYSVGHSDEAPELLTDQIVQPWGINKLWVEAGWCGGIAGFLPIGEGGLSRTQRCVL